MQPNLPDLPCLESQETSDSQALPGIIVFTGFTVWIAATCVWAFLKYRAFIPAQSAALIALLAGLTLFLIIRMLSGYFHFKTDPNGLAMRSVLRRRFIRWDEITEVSTRETRSGESILILRAGRTTLNLPLRGFGGNSTAGACITASIRQHLRRLGRGDDIQLSEAALTLWQDIPEAVPEEVQVGKSPTTLSKVAGALGLLMIVGVVVAGWVVAISNLHMLIWIVFVTVAFGLIFKWGLLPEYLYNAHLVSVKKDGLLTKVKFGDVYIPWSEITSVSWQQGVLRIRASRTEVRIVYKLGDKESERLILAIIRQLRLRNPSLAVLLPTLVSAKPEVLNRPAYSGQGMGMLKRAFISSLEEPARTHIRRLYHLQMVSMFIGIVLGGTVFFTDAIGRLSQYLHGRGAEYFLPGNSMAIGVILMFSCFILPMLIVEPLSARLAHPYVKEWMEFQKVGSGNGRLAKVCMYLLACIALAGVLMIPLFVDCYMRVTEKGVAVNQFWEFRERFYPWSQVGRATTEYKTNRSHGQSNSVPMYAVSFTDGTTWRFSPEDTFTRRDEMGKIVEYIAARCAGGR